MLCIFGSSFVVDYYVVGTICKRLPIGAVKRYGSIYPENCKTVFIKFLCSFLFQRKRV